MAREDERSLQTSPDLIPQHLTQGGLIIGALEGGRGSLMNLTGMALERITRERSELPSGSRLPERSIYLLDPNSKRMILISNREYPLGDALKRGLFAEIVELDEKGNPRFGLSTKEVILPDEQYQAIAVGPNKFKLPPSFIDMVTEEEPGKKKFVPWNIYLASLQSWMNEVTIGPDDDFKTFMTRFIQLKATAKEETERKVNTAFPDGPQAFSEETAPFNIIITDTQNRDKLMDASRDADLYPIFIDGEALARETFKISNLKGDNVLPEENLYSIRRFLPQRFNWGHDNYLPAVVTDDWNSRYRLSQNLELARDLNNGDPTLWRYEGVKKLLQHNRAFSYVFTHANENADIEKKLNGSYACPGDQDIYRSFLYKVKADLLLTMFVRGGAPIVK